MACECEKVVKVDSTLSPSSALALAAMGMQVKKQDPEKDLQDCVSKKIPKLIEEGKSPEQSAAIAYSMCRKDLGIVEKADPETEAYLEAMKKTTVAVRKADEEQRLVYGVVLEPNTPDTQGDVISAQEIEKSAHGYLAKSRLMGQDHTKQAQATPVESYIAPADFEINGQPVKKGSWVVVSKVHDEALWSKIKSGELDAYSVGGFGLRDKV